MTLTRRSLLSLSSAPLAMRAQRKHVPAGLELYSVREEIKADLFGTVREVAKLGYQGVEFWAPYVEWTSDYARQVRSLLDELNLRCWSTHTPRTSFSRENLPRAIELNQILGSKLVIMPAAGRVENADGWKLVADTLNAAAETLRPLGMRTGFHNHAVEWRPVDGVRPMDIIAKNTVKDVALQLDVGTCIEGGSDPVQWIKDNPGRIASLHMKDWSPDAGKGYRVLFGEGVTRWKETMDAAESVGGVEYYLIEQEGSQYPAIETARRCLENFKRLR